MTEAEWLACTDPGEMLASLRSKAVRSKNGRRRLRLFACGCCRQAWYLFKDKKSFKAIETAERYADGLAGIEELRLAGRGFKKWSVGWGVVNPDTWTAASDVPSSVATQAVNAAVYPQGWFGEDSVEIQSVEHAIWETACQRQQLAQASLLRDIFPFRRTRVRRRWLDWNNGMAAKLAQNIYRDRSFFRMPVLADVLEVAGCKHEGILDHCRSAGEHVRGCWVLDLLLGKQ